MKKILFAINILTIILFCSCNESFDNNKAPDYSVNAEQFDSIGILHNEGLEFIYSQLEDSINSYSSLNNVLANTKHATKNFIVSKNLTSTNLKVPFEYIDFRHIKYYYV